MKVLSLNVQNVSVGSSALDNRLDVIVPQFDVFLNVFDSFARRL